MNISKTCFLCTGTIGTYNYHRFHRVSRDGTACAILSKYTIQPLQNYTGLDSRMSDPSGKFATRGTWDQYTPHRVGVCVGGGGESSQGSSNFLEVKFN
jgi:hypothetical protein